MSRTGSTPLRLTSLLALIVLVSGWIGVPAVDAARFHQHSDAAGGQAHFDVAGGCEDHAESCALTAASSQRRMLLSPSPGISKSLPPTAEPERTGLIAPQLRLPGLSSSRAPPVSLA